MNQQTIILETDEGTANSEKELKELWEFRLRKAGLHYYKVKQVTINKIGGN